MEQEGTNQNYRKLLVKNAFELMKSNQRNYSKHSVLYMPKETAMAQEKKPEKK